MTEFKVGDVIRNIDNPHYEIGAIGKVIGVNDDGYVKVNLKSKTIYGERNYWAYQGWMELISSPSETPPATITHEGYTYTRGDRVLPDWLKDGAWVVNVGTGDLRQVKEVSPGVFDLATGAAISVRYGDHIRDQYRPHKPSDYKWGDWAMYEGKKVFVMAKITPDGRLAVSYPNMDGNCEHTGTSQWDYIHTSKLTPTHAP